MPKNGTIATFEFTNADGTYEIDGHFEDSGIGAYECHGTRGVDSRLAFYIDAAWFNGADVEQPTIDALQEDPDLYSAALAAEPS